MSTSTTNHMEDRINQLHKELIGKRRATNWSSNIVLVLGLLIILALCGYFGYGYRELDSVTQPREIVGAAKSYLEDFSVEARKTAGEEVQKSAPIWAKQASTELLANMPKMRESAEESFTQYFDEQVQKTKEFTRAEFSKIVTDNRSDFDEAINMLVEKGKSDEFVAKVMPIIEQQYAADMPTQVSNVLGGLQFINQQLEKLALGQDLNPIEQQQRYILGLARLMRN